MKKVSSYMGFSCGEEVCFYQDGAHPCVKGVIKTIQLETSMRANGALFRIKWGDVQNSKIVSLVPYKNVFKSEELCRAYADSVRRNMDDA